MVHVYILKQEPVSLPLSDLHQEIGDGNNQNRHALCDPCDQC